jgi:transposase
VHPCWQPTTLTVIPKGKRVNLIAAIGLQGFVHHRIVNPTGEAHNRVNVEEFRAFILDLAPKLPQGSVLLLNNVKIHHTEKMTTMFQMLEQTFGILHTFLPPYSPFMNPIEYAFNKLSGEVQKEPFWNQGELVQLLEKKIPCITSTDAEGFFTKSFSLLPPSCDGATFSGQTP